MDTVIPAAWAALNPSQRDVLVVLAVRGPAGASTIADAVGGPLHRSTVSRRLVALADMGYVERTRGDERVLESRLTDDGRALVERGVVDVASEARA